MATIQTTTSTVTTTSTAKPCRVFLFGHSFIRRLNEYMKRQEQGGRQPPRRNSNLSPSQFRVGCLGVGGGTISAKHGYPLRKRLFHISVAWPDIVYLDIGSNDLCSQAVSPAKLAGDLMKIARYLTIGCEVKMVVIGALLPRICIPHDVPDYNKRVADTNELIKSLASSEDRVSFCYHARFDNPGPGIYHPDGVHLSYQEGYKRYARSVRGAALRARKQARHLGLL